jgi:hypothetical protein
MKYLTAIGLTPGGSSTAHLYTQTIHIIQIMEHNNQEMIILPSTPGSLQWSLSLRFSHQLSVYASPLPHPNYMPRHLILLDFIIRSIAGEENRSWSSLQSRIKHYCDGYYRKEYYVVLILDRQHCASC